MKAVPSRCAGATEMFLRVQINGSYLETNTTWKFADKEVNMGPFRDRPGRKAHGTEG